MRRRVAPEPSAREHLASETHLALRPVRDRGRAVLVFPNTYRVGMSSLSLHTLYALLNARGLVCERAFLPAATPPAGLRSLESDTPLGGFDYILVTSSFELDWLNLPAMLEAGGAPALRRSRESHHPLVIAGGPALTANPEPVADLVDACIIGEIEPIGEEFARALSDSGRREEALERLGELPGVYLPGRAEHAPELGAKRARVARLWADDLDLAATESVILTPHTAFPDRFLIELGRGCGRGCKFCLARRIYRPVRARNPATLLARIDAALPHTKRVGLVSAAVSDYPWADELFGGLMERGARVSISSARAESVTEIMLAALAASGQETLTLAPECGSEALRRSIGKPMTDEDLLGCVALGVAAGIRRYKLYFMAGLPGETDEDAAAIPELVARLRRATPGARFSVSVMPFAPKPHTPFEGCEVLAQAALRRRLKAVEAALHRQGVHEVTVGSARWSAVQTVLSRGGRELSEALVSASRSGGGARAFREAVAEAGGDWEAYLGPQEFPEGAAPWEVVACAPEGGGTGES